MAFDCKITIKVVTKGIARSSGNNNIKLKVKCFKMSISGSDGDAGDCPAFYDFQRGEKKYFN